jgi:hypothetical protein
MSENISMTRIVDLPDMMGPKSGSSVQQNGMASDMYIPMNVHPNPYGMPPPPPGGINPPQQTQTGPTEYANTMYSSNINSPPPQKMNGSSHNGSSPAYSQEQMNEMYAQQASLQQRLPPRDIPMNTLQHTQDEEIQANYIPKPKLTSDYIQDYQETTDKKIREYERNKRAEKEAETWFDQLQMPIMVALLFFVFQLPIVNTLVFKRFSFLSIYREDGNFNLTGLTLKCILFGFVYFSLQKMVDIVSNF